MHQIISNIDEAVPLHQYIDNREGCKRVGLKCFTYTMGWYNINNQVIQIKRERPHIIPNGYYSFQQLADIFDDHGITLSVNENNGLASLITQNEVSLSDGLKSVLGIEGKKFKPEKEYTSTKPVDFAIVKSLYIHLEQLNTAHNFFNGMPSTILTTVPIENKQFGDVVTVRFEHPEFKYLSNGAVTDLELSVRDEYNHRIDNHDLSMCAVLEII